VRRALFSTSLLVALASLAAVGSADDDPERTRVVAAETDAARREVGELIEIADFYWRPCPGESPTTLFRRLLGRDPAVVQSVFEEAWRRSQARTDGAPDIVRRVAAFAYGAEGDPAKWRFRGWTDEQGAVEWNSGQSMRMSGGPSAVEPIDVLVQKKLRALPRVDVDAVLIAYDVPRFVKNAPGTAFHVALALGEACAADDAAFEKLLRRADAVPDDFCATALGASRRPAAVARLVAAARREAATSREPESFEGNERLRWIVRAIDAASPESLRALLDSLSSPQRDEALVALGGETVFARLVADVDRASDPDVRHAAQFRLCSLSQRLFDESPAAAARPLFQHLLDAVDSGDKGIRAAALKAVDALLYAFNHFNVPGGRIDGAFAGPERTLRTLVADLDAGRIEFRARRPSIWEPRPEERDWRGAPGGFRVDGAWTDAGLRLRLVNTGGAPLAFDPVGARYGTVTFATDTEGPGVPKKRLHLGLGFIRNVVVVPARELVRVAPGATVEWTLPVRAEHRVADVVEVDIGDHVAVVGDCDAPLVRFSDAVVIR